MNPIKYVVVTAAHNEERHIRATIGAVVAQTLPPALWVIVDDGSVDSTAAIVRDAAAVHPWIKLVRNPARRVRNFAGKAEAVRLGVEDAKCLDFEFMVNLDADVTFEADYFEYVVGRMADDPELGIAGTPFTEDGDYDSYRDSYEGENYVAGPCQVFRYRCFEDVGGYVANPAGGVDWIAVMTARMKGWKVRAFPGKRFHHHRSMGTAERGELRALFSYGEKDYYLGNAPVWELFRVAYRSAKKPRITGGLALLAGFVWAAVSRTPRAVTPELMRFHRAEQMQKLKAVVRSVLRFRAPDNFALTKTDAAQRADGKSGTSPADRVAPSHRAS